MSATHLNPLRPSFSGLFFDEFSPDSAWLREQGVLRLPPLATDEPLRLVGEILKHPEAQGIELGAPGLLVKTSGKWLAHLPKGAEGVWTLDLPVDRDMAAKGLELELVLEGVAFTNGLAWAGRVSGLGALQHFRKQNKNRQLRLRRLETNGGKVLCDFARRGAPFATDYVRRNLRIGLNIVGFLAAELGIGEGARCMVRGADAAGIPTSLVPLKLHCLNPQGERVFADRFQETNPQPVNIFHVDPPVSADIDHHHGKAFRAGKYNIGYWAWELPDFPDGWVEACRYFDEIWCPSDFVREAVSIKAPIPVLTMPHPIAFERPQGDFRARFGLPRDAFVFLFVYDLNSYSARKNPGAVLRAFRAAELAGKDTCLAIKLHNAAANKADFAALSEAVADLPGTVLISETLSRQDLIQLESACDCFVSLHRSEGFGLSIAECMYLGKPVIATDWSASAEFVNETNGCPVRCSEVVLERSYGPYGKGSRWAEPDIEHAAWWMQRLYGDRALAKRLGDEARKTIETRFSPAVIGARYRKRLEAIAMA